MIADRNTSLRLTAIASAVALSISVIPASASANDDEDARRAVTAANAKVDLVTKQGADATNHPYFIEAQKKLQSSKAAYDDDEERTAQWRAEEAAIYAEVALEASRYESLKATRTEVQEAINVLRSELQ